MKFLLARLDTTWKRALAALVLSGAIILAINTFAESTYVQSQKVQQESAAGQRCLKWTLAKVSGQSQPVCQKWQGHKP